jgi:hypothetical protein
MFVIVDSGKLTAVPKTIGSYCPPIIDNEVMYRSTSCKADTSITAIKDCTPRIESLKLGRDEIDGMHRFRFVCRMLGTFLPFC